MKTIIASTYGAAAFFSEVRMAQGEFLPANPSELAERFYHAHYERIHRYFKFRLFDKTRAEELSQTVFLKVFTVLKSGMWDGQGEDRYIFTIARNTLIDHFRRVKHAPIVSDEMMESLPDVATSSSTTQENEQRQMIMDGLKGMRVREAEAVSFRFLDDMKYSHIAEKMGKKEDAVRQLVHRGLKSLRIILEPRIAEFQF